jgi:hypothetical protein
MRGWVCRLLLLLVFTSAVILGSESRGTHDHILLSQIRDSLNPGARSPYLYPPGTGWPSYTSMHWGPFSSPLMTRRTTVEVFVPASTRETLHIHNNGQPVNAVGGNSRCLLWEPYGTHEYIVWAECRDFIYKNPVRTSQETHYVSATKPNRLMLFRGIVAVYCQNHTEHINILCGQNTKFRIVEQKI